MFILKGGPPAYTDPWNASFDDRLHRLVSGDRRVAYYYDYPDNSTFRYRVYNMIQALDETHGRVTAAYFSLSEQEALDRIVDLADMLVIVRSRYNNKLNQAITRAQRQGKPVYYDIDDFVFDTRYTHLIMNTVGEDLDKPSSWDYWFGYIGRLSATLLLCDRVITTNANLAACVQQFSSKPVSVIPNFINREQMELSNRIYQDKKAGGFRRDQRIHLGFFSGTPTHRKDFELITDALAELLHRDPRLHLRLMGFVNMAEPLRAFADRIEVTGLSDFLTLQYKMAEVEANLVPLQENVFTNCKSELKFFEAGVVGTLTIASPVYTYAQAIRDGENGFLAKSYQWFEKISALIQRLEEYPELAERAYQDSERKYAWYNQIGLIERTLFPEGR